MKRLGLILLRAAATAAGTAGAVALVANSDASPPVLAAGAVLLLATGALVDRYWTAALPLAYVVGGMAIDGAVNGTQDQGDLGWWGYFYVFAFVATGVSLVVLVGDALDRIARRHRGRRRAGSRPAPRVMA